MAVIEQEKIEPLTVTVEQAAELLGISRWSAYEAAKRGELPIVRIGKRILIPRRRLEKLLAGDDGQAAA